MNTIKYGILAVAAIFMMGPDAQAQNYTQRGTRNGAIAGAIIGGIVGANGDRPLAGAAIGGLIGGATGRAIGNAKDSRVYGSGFHNGGFQNTGGVYRQPRHHDWHGGNSWQSSYRQQSVARPIYSSGFHGGGHWGSQNVVFPSSGFGRSPYYGRSGCGR